MTLYSETVDEWVTYAPFELARASNRVRARNNTNTVRLGSDEDIRTTKLTGKYCKKPVLQVTKSELLQAVIVRLGVYFA